MTSVTVSSQTPFFIVGSPRSGTTLLRNLMRSHPNLTLVPESHFVPLLYRQWGDPIGEENRRRLIARVLNVHWVRNWRLQAQLSDFDGCTTYRDIVERLYRLEAADKPHARIGDKTPAYAHDIPTLCRIFPGAQFIHIIRDGRDVALSLKRVWFGFRHVYNSAAYWRDHVVAARRDGAPLGPERYVEIRYETLLQDTEGVMRRVCEFLGEPFDPRVLTPTGFGRFRKRSKRMRTPMIDMTKVVSSNADKWRTQMTRREIEIFETVAGDLLTELGYERVTSGRRIGRPLRAYWKVDEFVRRVAGYWSRDTNQIWVPGELALIWSQLRSRLKRKQARPAMPRES